MTHTLKYFFSFCLMLSLFLAQAQDTDTIQRTKMDQAIPEAPKPITKKLPQEIKTDTIIKTSRYGFRVGVDLYKLTRALYEKNYKVLQLVAFYRVKKKYFLAA